MDLRVLFLQQLGFLNQTEGILWFCSLRSLAFWYLGISASFINSSSKYITAPENYYFWPIMMWKMTMERSNSFCNTTKEGWSHVKLANFKQVSWLAKPLAVFIIFQENVYWQTERQVDIISVRNEVRSEGYMPLCTWMVSWPQLIAT